MMAVQGNTPEESHAVSPAAYAAFLRQIELAAIWLQEARISNRRGPEPPERATVRLDSHATWTPYSEGFRILHHYDIRIEDSDSLLAEIEVTFGLQFTSEAELTDELFSVFREVNLPVNTWPYLREFLATTAGRMNWVPFVLPTLKLGTEEPTTQPSRRRRRRRSEPS